MADVQVSLTFTGQEDVTQAAQKVEDAIKRVGKGQLKAEEDLKAIIARDDPGKAAEQRRDREIKRIAQYVSRHNGLIAQGEQARKAVIERYEREVAALRVKSAETSAQAVVTKMRPALSNIAQLTNAVGNAAGASASKFTALATGVAGAFSAGAPYAAIAGFSALVTALVGRFVEVKEAAAAAAKEIDEKFAEARKNVFGTGSDLERDLRLQQFLLGGGSESQFNAQERRAGFQAEAARGATDLARASERLGKLASRRSDLLQDRDALAADGRSISAVDQQLKDLEAEIRAAREEVRRAALIAGQAAKNTLLAGIPIEGPTVPGLPGPPSAGGVRGGFVRRGGAPAGPSGDPFATRESLAAFLDREVDRAREQDAAAEAADQAKRIAKVRAQAENKAHQEELSKEAKSDAYVKAGLAAGGQFVSGFAQILSQGGGNAPSIFGVFSAALGTLLSIANPAAGAAFGAFSGAIGLRSGGGYIPQGRAGLGNAGNDARLAFMHPREVIMSAPAVEAMGGMDGALRFNEAARTGRPMRGGGGQNVTIVLSSLVPKDAAAAVKQVVRPGFETILSNRQSGALRNDMQRFLERPRAS
jgi:hypothetical protein